MLFRLTTSTYKTIWNKVGSKCLWQCHTIFMEPFPAAWACCHLVSFLGPTSAKYIDNVFLALPLLLQNWNKWKWFYVLHIQALQKMLLNCTNFKLRALGSCPEESAAANPRAKRMQYLDKFLLHHLEVKARCAMRYPCCLALQCFPAPE